MAGERPTKRNPMMVTLIALGAIVGGQVIGNILASATGVGVLASALSVAGYVIFCLTLAPMVGELKRFTGGDITPWWVWVPILNLILLVVKVPAEMTKAKQMAGVQAPVRPVWMYFLLSPFALSSDLNDIAG